MSIKNKIKLLKIAFWIGAVTDGIAAIIMIFPQLRSCLFGSDNLIITPQYRYALGLGAALMVGWTVLLIWGSLKPLERKGILLITIFPVITGIVIAQIYSVVSDYVQLTKMIPIWIHLTFITCLYLIAYFRVKNVSK